MSVNLKSLFSVHAGCLAGHARGRLGTGDQHFFFERSSRRRAGWTTYASSKGGVIAFTKSLALELAASGVTVNNIPPGFCRHADASVQRSAGGCQRRGGRRQLTDEAGRDGPKISQRPVRFLASEDAGYITGHNAERERWALHRLNRLSR